jgi:hypothetical protein
MHKAAAMILTTDDTIASSSSSETMLLYPPTNSNSNSNNNHNHNHSTTSSTTTMGWLEYIIKKYSIFTDYMMVLTQICLPLDATFLFDWEHQRAVLDPNHNNNNNNNNNIHAPTRVYCKVSRTTPAR